MERVMTVEEKIRRAEEIYQRRKQEGVKPIAKVTVNDKKDIKLLKKMIIQILICTVIYLAIYIIQNNKFIFSQDFINKANEILSYDTNFLEIYEGIKNSIEGMVHTEQEKVQEQQQEEDAENMAIGGAIEQTQHVINEIQESNIEGENSSVDNEQNLSQEEINIQNIKNTTTFIKPIEGIITSGFGERDNQGNSSISTNHNGVDIGANLGTKIKSSTDGEVVLASEEGGYGKHIKVQIGEVSIIYAHCNNLYVKQGDKIVQGQEIAEVGSTGNSTGPHLHFEIRISEQTVNPQSILEL